MIDDIRARHAEMGTFCPTMAPRQVHDDRGALLAEVDRLTAALDAAQKQAAAWEVLAQDRGDLLQRLRGVAGMLGRAWAAAGYPPLPELDWLQKDTP